MAISKVQTWPAAAAPRGKSSSDATEPESDEDFLEHRDKDNIAVQAPVVGNAGDFSYPSWKTVSVYPTYVAEDEDEEQPSTKTKSVDSGESKPSPANLTAQALELEKQAAELKAAAQNCRNMAQMQSVVDGSGAVGQQMANAYAPMGIPMAPMAPMMMPWQTAAIGMPMMPMHMNMMSQMQGASATSGRTTVMWRNLPNNYTRDDLCALMDAEGFAGCYDFFYAPADFTSSALVGYAFVNFVVPEEADRFYYHFQGFTRWNLASEKVSEITWSQPLQGLAGHIERYRNSPVMHSDVPDDRRPLLLRDGVRVPFPPPTRKLRAPNLKECRPK